MSLLREPLLTRSTAEGEKLKPRAGSHYRLIFILAGWKKKVTQLEMKIKLITLGLHFNQVKIKNFNHRQSAGKLTFTWTNHAGPNRALYITILVLLFSAIQKQRNQLLAFVFVMDRWLNSCNCCCHLEGHLYGTRWPILLHANAVRHVIGTRRISATTAWIYSRASWGHQHCRRYLHIWLW